MPYTLTWVPPAVFLRRAGVTIYHTYCNEEVRQGTRDYHFTTSEDCGESRCDSTACEKAGRCVHVFDVRNLPHWLEEPPDGVVSGTEAHVRRVLQEAIDDGTVTSAGVDKRFLGGEPRMRAT